MSKSEGKVTGKRYSTDALRAYGKKNEKPEVETVKVQWSDGGKWPLMQLSDGNMVYRLPVERKLISLDELEAFPNLDRVFVLVAQSGSGLASFFHWVTEQAKLKERRLASVDLREVLRREGSRERPLDAIARALEAEIEIERGTEKSVSKEEREALIKDPLDTLRQAEDQSSNEKSYVVFRYFEELTEQAGEMFFPRLRGLVEREDRPLRNTVVMLLGHSVQVLRQDYSASNLLSVAQVLTTANFTEHECGELLVPLWASEGSREGVKKEEERKKEGGKTLFEWTGGHPLLVQAVCRLLAERFERNYERIPEAAQELAMNPNPAMESWQENLRGFIHDHRDAFDRIQLLLDTNYDMNEGDPRIDRELYVLGWINREKDDTREKGDAWTMRSRIHRILARDVVYRTKHAYPDVEHFTSLG